MQSQGNKLIFKLLYINSRYICAVGSGQSLFVRTVNVELASLECALVSSLCGEFYGLKTYFSMTVLNRM